MKNIKVVFANQKGGVGKSTLCMLFANYLSWKGKPVCIIDTDLQKTILMQRQKDVQIYDEEEPYSVQSFDVSAPELMQQLMDTLDSTGVFVKVINALKDVNPEMHAQIFFVPNRIDPRIGTSDEQRMWSDTNDIFSQIGKVTPMVNSRATLKRINTFELLATQREAVKGAFEYMIKRMK